MRRAAALIAAVVAAGFSLGTDPRAEAQAPIRIGASISQTGSLAPMGQNTHRGYQLCIKHANEKGGVLGRRIELLVEDDQSQGPTAAAIYEKLITQDKMDAIFGPYSSPLTEAMADVSERHRMPMVSLKKRLDAAGAGRVPSPAFIELPAARPTGLGPCVINLEGRRGRRLRIEVAGMTVADLVTLTQVAWGRDR